MEPGFTGCHLVEVSYDMIAGLRCKLAMVNFMVAACPAPALQVLQKEETCENHRFIFTLSFLPCVVVQLLYRLRYVRLRA